MRFLTVALPKFNLKKFPKDEDYSSYKLNIFSLSSKKIDYFLQYLEEKYHNQLDITHHNHLIEICTKNVNKGSAISKVCSLLDIQIENTAAIGDSNNDIDMFRNVKFKFAINHSEYLVEHADIVFKHQKNAVAKMIDDYILKNEK
jgi:hydroxymethylpyrimidine pyrophosphatase-like HAD family hydrolase